MFQQPVEQHTSKESEVSTMAPRTMLAGSFCTPLRERALLTDACMGIGANPFQGDSGAWGRLSTALCGF